MKKAKDIMNTTTLTRLVMALAVLLSLVAVFLVVTKRTPSQMRAERLGECKSVVMVASGDTLSKLLLEQGLSHSDVNAVAQVLKANADITTLRADRDKLEFVRESDDAPVYKIVVIPSPWRQVELTCNDTGMWDCKTVDIERDTRAEYRTGEILDGDSF